MWVLGAVRAGHPAAAVDVGVRIGPLPDSSMVARRVGVVRRAIAASPGYLARRGTPERPADLLGHDCLDFAGFRRGGAWDLSAGEGDTAPLPIRPRLTIDAAEPLVDAAVAGAGIVSLFSYHLAAAVKAGAVDWLEAPCEAEALLPAVASAIRPGAAT